ncbi:MAG: transporter substrate-binding domain-containing protein [Bermanella sp.]
MRFLVKYKCILLFLLMFPSIGNSETTNIRTINIRTINISTIDWCPFICPSNAEKPGFLVEYTQAIFNKAGIKVRFTAYPWSRAILNTEQGATVALLSPAKEEAPSLVYPKTKISIQRHCFFSLTEDPWEYKKPASVIGKKILYPQDALPEPLEKFREQAQLTGLPYTKTYNRQATRMLQVGRVESIIMTYYTGSHYLNNNHLSEDIKVSGCIDSQDLYLAFTPNKNMKDKVKKIMAVFENGISELKKVNYFEGLLKKYKLD